MDAHKQKSRSLLWVVGADCIHCKFVQCLEGKQVYIWWFIGSVSALYVYIINLYRDCLNFLPI